MERLVAVKTWCKALPPGEVTDQESDGMWNLFQSTYTGVTRGVFESDYRDKDRVLHLWEGGELVGFTSMVFRQIGNHRVVYSGDIVIAPRTRGVGTIVFFREWAREVVDRADWWLSLTSGVRTYRILHTFYYRITPGPGFQETGEERRLRNSFATAMYGDAYDPATGVVRLKYPYSLREESKPPRKADPVDAFFVKSNSGWGNGDELVSLVKLSLDNWKPAAMRMLHW